MAGSVAADWAGDDAGLRPGAVLGEGEWVVRAPEAAAEPDDWTVADPELPAAGQPSLNLWPTPDPAAAAAGPAAAQPAKDPATAQPAEDGEPDDGPVHRVESAFNVWQRPDQDAGPAAAPPDVAPPDAAAPGRLAPESMAAESVAAESAAAEFVTAESVAPAPADQDQPAAAAPSTRDWVQRAAARLRDADLLPDADPPPARGLRPPAHGRPADDEAELDPIIRPPAPRRSSPAPGWNPDSEEDWLRVLRGLRASEDS